jgi:hypothetical protein
MDHGKSVSMHRQLMGMRGKHIDHRNHNGLDNRRSNMRRCNYFQSVANRRKNRNNKSGYKGVSPKTDHSWVAVIYAKGKRFHLGVFKSPVEAAYVYDKAARKCFGEFAHLNFP